MFSSYYAANGICSTKAPGRNDFKELWEFFNDIAFNIALKKPKNTRMIVGHATMTTQSADV